MLAGFISLCTVMLIEEDEEGRKDTKEHAKAENDKVTDAFRQGGRSTEVGINSPVSFERRDFNFSHGCLQDVTGLQIVDCTSHLRKVAKIAAEQNQKDLRRPIFPKFAPVLFLRKPMAT